MKFWVTFSLVVISFCYCITESGATEKAGLLNVATTRYSYFALDTQGNLALKDGLPYREEKEYAFMRTIQCQKTALIIMDPWVDNPTEHLNEHCLGIIESRIIPLIRPALHKKISVIVLSNNPAGLKYGSKIHPILHDMVQRREISLLFHDKFDDDAFAAYLRDKGIHSLIYTGFSSNVCVIGRRTGMIPMIQQGFRIFFVPEASSAVEFRETWETGENHRAITRMVSQWIAELIDCDDLMEALVGDI